MDTYELKLGIVFFNFLIFGDWSLEGDSEKTEYLDQDLAKFGIPGAIMIGTSLSSLSVATNNTESDDPDMLRRVEVIVDESAARRDDAFFEKVMPLGGEGLAIVQVAESDHLPIINNEKVYVPIPWSGVSTIQLIAPDGFVRDPEDNYLVESLRIVVSPEIPQP